MNYFLLIEGKEYGPTTLGEIEEAVRDNTITPAARVRSEKEAHWRAVRELLPHLALQGSEGAKSGASVAETFPESKVAERLPTATPSEYLREIRRHSCYRMLRAVVNLSFALMVISIIAGAIVTHEGRMLYAITGAILALVLLLAAREAALLIIDIADALLHRHSRQQRP